MPAIPTYSPLTPQSPADIIREDTCDTRRFMNPLTGICHTHRISQGYRHASPNGDRLRLGIEWHHSDVPQPTANYSLLTAHSSYTFSAKEKDSETGLSYFGSRYYSSDLSIWLSVDPMSDKYASLSPYVYCADNPVKLVDPNGEDYEVIVVGNTITIKAVYYTANENKEKLQLALDAWNAQSGKYSYVVGTGKDKEIYTVNFELTIAKGDFDTDKASTDFLKDNSGMANFVEPSNEIYNKDKEPIDGEANNNVIHFRPEASVRTMSHEVGHTLGIGDWELPNQDQEDKGELMTTGGKSDVINKSHIATCLKVKGYYPQSSYSGISINPSNHFQVSTMKKIGKVKYSN